MQAADPEAASFLVTVCFQLFDWDLTGNESIGSLLSPALSCFLLHQARDARAGARALHAA